jgi:hypothetical protein
MSYGHMLKTVGRQADGVAAYRKALALVADAGRGMVEPRQPQDGALRRCRYRRDGSRARADRPGDEDRFHLDFALGKAFEDRREAEPRLRALCRGQPLRRTKSSSTSADETERVRRRLHRALHARILRRARRLGQRRARSDLHPRHAARGLDAGRADPRQPQPIEGTTELPDIPALARETPIIRTALAELTAERYARTGRGISAPHRGPAPHRPALFIDKLPNNWAHVPLIRLILPNATIIDARRHPLACCFSNFKQHFARGQAFSYALDDMGRYYRDYVRLMAHLDRVQPGRVHRVIHEALVDDTEAEVRALLAACGVDFEPACLAFHEDRARRAHRQLRAGAPADLHRRGPRLAPVRAASRSAQGRAGRCPDDIPIRAHITGPRTL